MTSEQLLFHGFQKSYSTLRDPKYICPVCGKGLFEERACVISDVLASAWDIDERTREAFDYREGCVCRSCRASVRIRNLAATLLETLNHEYRLRLCSMANLANLPSLWKWRIAEINNCQVLHRYLASLPKLSYSEYRSSDPAVPFEDVTSLSYTDDCFDIILMTDVLEHVPDYRKGLEEVKRVLSPEGAFIFTVPLLTNRHTRSRAEKIENGSIKHLLPPSYHGDSKAFEKDLLVFHEFGIDFIDDLISRFHTQVYGVDDHYGFVSAVFVCKK